MLPLQASGVCSFNNADNVADIGTKNLRRPQIEHLAKLLCGMWLNTKIKVADAAEKKEDKAMAYMHALQAAQQSTKSAHVVLTGVQAIKPNDVKAARHAAMAESGHAEPKRKKAKPAI